MQVPYSVLSQGRQEAFERFGTIFELPIVRSPYEYLKQFYQEGLVLDVGAGADHYLQQVLGLDDETYHSLDNDPAGQFTYTDVTQIPLYYQYQWMVLNQLLEHLTIEETADLLVGLHGHLAPGGRMVITVPNISHPIRYRTETHVTPWSYGGLYAMCQFAGYEVLQIYRYSKNRGPLDPLSWIIERVMRRLYRIDWCQSIMLIATR